MREARLWGAEEKLFEGALPRFEGTADVAALIQAAQVVDGLMKGMRHPQWPADPWDGMKRLLLIGLQYTATPPGARGKVRTQAQVQRLALLA